MNASDVRTRFIFIRKTVHSLLLMVISCLSTTLSQFVLITHIVKSTKNQKGKPYQKDLPFLKTISQYFSGFKNLSFIAGICNQG